MTEISFKNAQRMVDRLAADGILREVTGQKRYRVYCAEEILRLLDESLAIAPAPGPPE